MSTLMTRSMPGRGAWACAALLLSCTASAHGTGAPWTFEGWVVAPLLLAAAMFVAGAWRIRRRSRLAWSQRRQWTWLALGWLVLAGAVLSPLHAAGERSFAAHMLEHELLMLVAAPLLVLGRPAGVALWALPRDLRLALGRWTRHAAFAGAWGFVSSAAVTTVLQLLALWVWHAPALFERALHSDGWHIAQHVSFLVTALLFWQTLLRHPRTGVAVACLFLTALVSGALGGLMALSTSPWYASYAELGMTPYGLTPAEDQQLAGLLMWVPGGLLHAVVALLLLGRALNAEPARRAWTGA